MSPITYKIDMYIYIYNNDIIICYMRNSAHKKKAQILCVGAVALYLKKSKQYSAHEQDLLPSSCGRCFAYNMFYVIRDTAPTRRRRQILFVGVVLRIKYNMLYAKQRPEEEGNRSCSWALYRFIHPKNFYIWAYMLQTLYRGLQDIYQKKNRIGKESLRTSPSTQKRKPASGFFIGIETVKTFFGSNLVIQGGGE